MRRSLAISVVLLLALATTPLPFTPAVAADGERYIVVLRPDAADPGAEAAALAQSHGLAIRHVYRHAFKGFSATVPAAAVQGLSRNPRVVLLEADRPVELAQTLPTGIDRIDADLDSTASIDGDPSTGNIGVGIAILDTGVDLGHSDLNVAGGVDCVPGDGKESYDDDHGHGTHVAGIAAARDDSSGVVGAAPGAPIWSVKVMPGSGPGSWSDVVCGIDWVTARAGSIPIANISLTGIATSSDLLACGDAQASAIHRAICTSVAAGVTYAVAAGNQAGDASAYIPATFPEVITVSAMADFDGRPGALSGGSYTCSLAAISHDDSFSCFSNRGSAVDIAAPGVSILSTARGGGTAVRSGTSMASPHVAGAAALYVSSHPGATPSSVLNGLIAAADESTAVLSNPGDPDGIHEAILSANLSGTAPSPTATTTPSPTRTPTATASPTRTPTATPSATAVPPTIPAPTATATPVPTATPTTASSPSPTSTPSPLPTATSTPTAPPPTPTNTPEPAPPVISGIAVKAGKTTATVTWTTDVPASSTVRFGEAGAIDRSVSDGTLTTSHSITVTGLDRRTDYTFVVESAANGLTATSGGGTFRTR